MDNINNKVTVISELDARVLCAGATPSGYSMITASGEFSSAHVLANGARVECYINFGWPKYFLVPANYRETESPMARRARW